MTAGSRSGLTNAYGGALGAAAGGGDNGGSAGITLGSHSGDGISSGDGFGCGAVVVTPGTSIHGIGCPWLGRVQTSRICALDTIVV